MRRSISSPDRYDLFVALDWDKVEQFAAEIPLDETSVVLADPAAGAVPAGIAKSKARAVWLAMSEPKGKHDEGERRVNMVAVGAVAALAGVDAAHVPPAIEAVYAGKDAALIAANKKSAEFGANAAAGAHRQPAADHPRSPRAG